MGKVDEKEGKGQGHEKALMIVVNAREFNFTGDEISFDQVIELAFGSVSADPNIAYTVTYKRGHGNKPEGSMIKGDRIKVKEGMIFNATATNKS